MHLASFEVILRPNEVPYPLFFFLTAFQLLASSLDLKLALLDDVHKQALLALTVDRLVSLVVLLPKRQGYLADLGTSPVAQKGQLMKEVKQFLVLTLLLLQQKLLVELSVYHGKLTVCQGVDGGQSSVLSIFVLL